MGEPSYANVSDQVDDFYGSKSGVALQHVAQDPSHENYFSAITISPQQVKIAWKDRASSPSSSYQPQVFCKICMETVPTDKVFQTNNDCPHVFCSDCLSLYISTKIRENTFVVRCPEENCKAVLEPGMCRDLLTSEVFKRWKVALCESMALGAEKPNFGEDLLMMQEEEKRSCSWCKYFGEKRDGCLHITCRRSISHADGSIPKSELMPSEVAAADKELKQEVKVVEVITVCSVSREKPVADVPKQTTSKKKLIKEILTKADAAGSSGL
ncbi:hypothetical protein LUZ61_008585 [Rhynchospora tenuis]|uniref:RING-type domain-containing protein n=1 Tax=Rhynchospora tenuis TaxID=198213 RepID=A0AAD5ZVK2_9POAL|nr:hypothetical protein LUZ61_008585 [Rhynchospora tenuis]